MRLLSFVIAMLKRVYLVVLLVAYYYIFNNASRCQDSSLSTKIFEVVKVAINSRQTPL